MTTVTMPGSKRIARSCFQAGILSHLLQHHRPASTNPRRLDRSKSDFFGGCYLLGENLAGNVNLRFGRQQLPARLEASVDLTQ